MTAAESADNPIAGRRFLIVEDEALVAMMVADMLADFGATSTHVASSLSQGLEAATDAVFDAAILDINLNGDRSDPIADALRAKGVPIVFATGYGDAASTDDGAPVIAKPYTEESLAAALRRAMRELAGSGETVG